MTRSKRVLDLTVAVILSVVLAPVILLISLAILRRDGAPVIYRSERMQTPDRGFMLWKFRTMTVVESDCGVSGGDKRARITETGRFLRRYRLDELPQLLNILRGDMSFVGPRPPLRHYVERFPQIYREVLKSRPGVTGLATLVFHAAEERILAPCSSAAQTDSVYARRCIPRKARLDLLYARKRNICFDLRLMFATLLRRIPIRRKPG